MSVGQDKIWVANTQTCDPGRSDQNHKMDKVVRQQGRGDSVSTPISMWQSIFPFVVSENTVRCFQT